MGVVAVDRKQKITALAEAKGLELVKNNLASSDPALAPLCQRLARFKALLGGQELDVSKAKSLLQSGFAMVQFTPQDGSDEAEAVRLLEALGDKLGSMGGMLGGL